MRRAANCASEASERDVDIIQPVFGRNYHACESIALSQREVKDRAVSARRQLVGPPS